MKKIMLIAFLLFSPPAFSQTQVWGEDSFLPKTNSRSAVGDDIRSSGDIVKSLAAGASAVMLGSLLAGTKEAPGDVIASGKEKALYKVYRGSASFGDKKLRGENQVNIEGTEALVPYKGTVEDIVYSLCDGIRSGMSYVGAKNMVELRENAKFVEITNNGLAESHPHGLR